MRFSFTRNNFIFMNQIAFIWSKLKVGLIQLKETKNSFVCKGNIKHNIHFVLYNLFSFFILFFYLILFIHIMHDWSTMEWPESSYYARLKRSTILTCRRSQKFSSNRHEYPAFQRIYVDLQLYRGSVLDWNMNMRYWA